MEMTFLTETLPTAHSRVHGHGLKVESGAGAGLLGVLLTARLANWR